MTTEIKLVTWLLCSSCGEHIPYDAYRVLRQLWKGGRWISSENLCWECDQG